MAWQNPKTDWETGDVPGAGDFNRIEENEQWLKQNVESVIRYVYPSNTAILSATAERSKTGNGWSIVKRFRVQYAGVYRVRFQCRVVSTTYNWSVGVRVASDLNLKEIARTNTNYSNEAVEIRVVAGETITISLRGDTYTATTGGGPIISHTTGYIRNVYVCGTLGYTADIPGDAVLQN